MMISYRYHNIIFRRKGPGRVTGVRQCQKNIFLSLSANSFDFDRILRRTSGYRTFSYMHLTVQKYLHNRMSLKIPGMVLPTRKPVGSDVEGRTDFRKILYLFYCSQTTVFDVPPVPLLLGKQRTKYHGGVEVISKGLKQDRDDGET
jgi:hypothetical protein